MTLTDSMERFDLTGGAEDHGFRALACEKHPRGREYTVLCPAGTLLRKGQVIIRQRDGAVFVIGGKDRATPFCLRMGMRMTDAVRQENEHKKTSCPLEQEGMDHCRSRVNRPSDQAPDSPWPVME